MPWTTAGCTAHRANSCGPSRPPVRSHHLQRATTRWNSAAILHPECALARYVTVITQGEPLAQ